MIEYILLKSGRRVTEEELETAYRCFSNTTFNEIAYKAWKFDRILAKAIQIAE